MRPAFYALAPGGWRDYVTLIHLPYTAWHLSYVVIGACLAPHVPGWRLVLTVVAFFLGLGVGAHALDELNGRPLQTRIPTGALVALAAGSLAAASAIGPTVSSIQRMRPSLASRCPSRRRMSENGPISDTSHGGRTWRQSPLTMVPR